MAAMFTVDEPTAEAIRRAVEGGGELAGVVELRRHFPLIADNAHARRCVQVIVGWAPLADHSRSRTKTGPARGPAGPRNRAPSRKAQKPSD